jgi:predicted xylose isomerase-like sugar epimerase
MAVAKHGDILEGVHAAHVKEEAENNTVVIIEENALMQ